MENHISSKTYFYRVKSEILSKLDYLEHDLHEICGVDIPRIREVLIEEIISSIDSVSTEIEENVEGEKE